MKNLLLSITLVFYSFTCIVAQTIIKDLDFKTGTGFKSMKELNCLIRQKDEKLVIGGNFLFYNDVSCNNIVRLNIDGTIDTSFHTGTGFNNTVRDIVQQQNGKLVVIGDFQSYNNKAINTIVRLNKDGSIDTTFRTGTGFSRGGIGLNKLLALNNDKLIVNGSFMQYNDYYSYGIIRLNTNGTVDSSFNTGVGFVFASSINSVIERNDGKLVIGGLFDKYNDTTATNIVCINTDGSIYRAFKSTVKEPVKLLMEQKNGQLIAFIENNQNMFYLLDSKGKVDSVYAKKFSNSPPSKTTFSTILKTPDDQLIISGNFSNYDNFIANKIIRLSPNFIPDKSFITLNGFNGVCTQIVQQSDGKLVAIGKFTTFNGKVAESIIRLKESSFKIYNDEANSIGCKNREIKLITAYNKAFNTNNKHIIQLSDSTGNFNKSNTILGMFTSTSQNAMFSVTIPDTIKTSKKYLIRDITTSPIDTSSLLPFSINDSPETPSIYASRSTICKGNSTGLIATPYLTPNMNWYWYFNNKEIPNTNTVSYSAMNAGEYSVVIGMNDCRSNISPSVKLTTINVDTPKIVLKDSILSSTQASTYQWYKDNVVLQGATNQKYTVKSGGIYRVETNDYNYCTAKSNEITIQTTNINSLNNINNNFLIAPNPFHASTSLTYTITSPQNVYAVIYNSVGQLVKTIINERQAIGKYNFSIDNLPKGIYILYIQNDSYNTTKRLISVE